MTDDFKEHLEEATRIVSEWPAWKQKMLGGEAKPPCDCTNCKTRRIHHDKERFMPCLKQLGKSSNKDS